MVDTCTVSTWTGRTAQDEETGDEDKVYDLDFTSKCRFQLMSQEPQTPSVGGRRDAIDEIVLHLPVSSEQVTQGQVVECTAVGAGSDPRLVGRKWVVSVPMNKTYATATRLRLKELP